RNGGELQHDPAQELAAEKLQALCHALKGYQPQGGASGWKARLGLARRYEDPPQGLYIYGPVGTGKSMLMNIFFEAVEIAKKRRVHFHAFMTELQDRLHAWRQTTKGKEADPLPTLAASLAGETHLLCFDEFHVVNIADAMILGRLFESLIARGVVVVATSNWEPDRLYEGGLQRERFLPFIAYLKQHLDILELDGGRDYRRQRLKLLAVYHAPLGPRTDGALAQAFQDLTDGAGPAAESVTVKGRSVPVPLAARGVARFDFEDLCGKPLGAEDYLTLARRYHTLVIGGVPALSPDNRDKAKRFMLLVDALYEAKTKLILGADAPPDSLYPRGDGSEEFLRTASRLIEMRSTEYLGLEHLG
ncbi:MAG: cell division protein ZapE, partial [Rhodospirillales bacterium]|nr:cell division protein ZapE [Rhodospirillales bacterium]